MKISARDVQVSGGWWSHGARRNVGMEAFRVMNSWGGHRAPERKSIYIASFILRIVSKRSVRYGSHSFTCKLHHACLFS